jgi:hypothetical protein
METFALEIYSQKKTFSLFRTRNLHKDMWCKIFLVHSLNAVKTSRLYLTNLTQSKSALVELVYTTELVRYDCKVPSIIVLQASYLYTYR